MCLDFVSNSIKPVKKGYVVVRKTENGNYRPLNFYKSDNEGRPCVAKPGVWYNAKAVSRAEPTYIRGFHVWHTLKAAKWWLALMGLYGLDVIVLVEVGDVICTGTQDGKSVTVAHERRIIKEVWRCQTNAI